MVLAYVKEDAAGRDKTTADEAGGMTKPQRGEGAEAGGFGQGMEGGNTFPRRAASHVD